MGIEAVNSLSLSLLQLHLKIGNVVVLTSRTCTNKCLVVDANGMLFCNGNPLYVNHLPSQFEVVGSTYSNTAIKLRSVAYPQYYLAIVNGCFVGNVSLLSMLEDFS